MSAPTKTARQPDRVARAHAPDFQGLGLNFVGLVVGIAVWWVLTASGAVGLPPPSDVARKFVELAADGQLATDIASVLPRVLSGFLIGVILAISSFLG